LIKVHSEIYLGSERSLLFTYIGIEVIDLFVLGLKRRIDTMTPIAKKILPVALVAAVLGGTAGAFISKSVRSGQETTPVSTPVVSPSQLTTTGNQTAENPNSSGALETNTAATAVNDPASYNNGFNDGLKAGNEKDALNSGSQNRVSTVRTRGRLVRSSSSRRAYYDYSAQPRSRSFWDKHRDKLTVAMGAGGGAILGGLIGGKRGAGIGALAGGGGSALYTYKLRKRQPSY
jgi:hypothetical protein